MNSNWLLFTDYTFHEAHHIIGVTRNASIRNRKRQVFDATFLTEVLFHFQPKILNLVTFKKAHN